MKKIVHIDIPDTGLLCDLLWADPDKDIVGWGDNDRGVSFTFGEDVVAQFLRRHDLDLICRAHQVVEDGYEFFARRQLVTIFSAPNYCGEFDNAGAMMSVDDTLMCSFQILKPAEKKQRITQAGVGDGKFFVVLTFVLFSWFHFSFRMSFHSFCPTPKYTTSSTRRRQKINSCS